MKTYLIKILMAAILIFAACKKNSEPMAPIESNTMLIYRDLEVEVLNQSGYTYLFDTIRPNKYYPAFPGSWWRYLNESGDTVIREVSENYMKDSLGGWNYYYISWVPFINGIGIWGNYYNCCILSNGDSGLSKLFIASDTVNVSWLSGSISPGPNYKTYTKQLAFDTSIFIGELVYDSVIVVESHTEYGVNNWTRIYYCKNIGIIKKESIDPDGEYHERNLIDYFINQ